MNTIEFLFCKPGHDGSLPITAGQGTGYGDGYWDGYDYGEVFGVITAHNSGGAYGCGYGYGTVWSGRIQYTEAVWCIEW